MGILKYYKRDPTAALHGMACLDLVERGAYNTVLDLIYAHDGKLPDNDREIASWLAVDIRRWRRIRKRLIEKEKLYSYAGELHNRKADEVVEMAFRRIALASEAANKRWAAYNEIKRLADADAMRPHYERNANQSLKERNLSARLVPVSTTDKKKNE